MVLLLSEYVEQEFKVSTLQPNTKLLDVTGIGHSCVGLPHKCHGQPHEVTVVDATCMSFDSEDNRRTLAAGPFNVLIVRHGVASPPILLGAGPAAAPYRQVLPYTSMW